MMKCSSWLKNTISLEMIIIARVSNMSIRELHYATLLGTSLLAVLGFASRELFEFNTVQLLMAHPVFELTDFV